MGDRQLPYSEEAEKALIGCLLREPDITLALCRQRNVTIEDIWMPVHKIIFGATSECVNKLGPNRADYLLICNHMKENGSMEEIGGPLVVECIFDAMWVREHLDYYIDIIKQKAKARNALDVYRRSEKKLYDGEDTDDTISESVSELMQTENQRRSRPLAELHELHIAQRERAHEYGHSGLSSGFDDIQAIKGGYADDIGECIAVGARTRVGKTTFAINEVMHWTLEEEAPVAFVSIDMSEELLTEKFAASIGKVNAFKFRTGHWTERDAGMIDEGYRKLERMPLYIEHGRLTCDDIISYGTMMKMKFGIRALVVDYIQLIHKTDREWRSSFPQVVGEWVARIKDLGQRFNMATIILSQLNTRDREKDSEKTPPRPNLGAFKDSSSIEENVDSALMLTWKPNQPIEDFTHAQQFWPTDCGILKNKLGPTGWVPLMHHVTRQRFMPYEDGAELRDALECDAAREADIAARQTGEKVVDDIF